MWQTDFTYFKIGHHLLLVAGCELLLPLEEELEPEEGL